MFGCRVQVLGGLRELCFALPRIQVSGCCNWTPGEFGMLSVQNLCSDRA